MELQMKNNKNNDLDLIKLYFTEKASIYKKLNIDFNFNFYG